MDELIPKFTRPLYESLKILNKGPGPRPMAFGSKVMLGRSCYTESTQRVKQTYIGSVHILFVSTLVSVPVSDSVNEPLMGLGPSR